MSIEQLAKAITDGMQLAFTQIRAESRTSGEVLIKEMAKQTQELTQALRSVTIAQPNIQVHLPKFTGQGDLATWLIKWRLSSPHLELFRTKIKFHGPLQH